MKKKKKNCELYHFFFFWKKKSRNLRGWKCIYFSVKNGTQKESNLMATFTTYKKEKKSHLLFARIEKKKRKGKCTNRGCSWSNLGLGGAGWTWAWPDLGVGRARDERKRE